MLEWRRVDGEGDEGPWPMVTDDNDWFTRPGPLYLPDGDGFQLVVKTTGGALVRTSYHVRDAAHRVLVQGDLAYVVAADGEEDPALLRICLATGEVRTVWQFEWNDPRDLVVLRGGRLAAALDEGLSLYRDEPDGLVLERQWSAPRAWSLTAAAGGDVLIAEEAKGTWVIGFDQGRAAVLSRLQVPMCIDVRSAAVRSDRVRVTADFELGEQRRPVYEADGLASAHAAAFAPGAPPLDELPEPS